MLAARLRAPQTATVERINVPTLGDHEVLIEVRRAGICGTDLHIWHGSYELAKYPMTPGHEFAGVVQRVGSEVQTVRVGDRVTADPNLPCYRCYCCQRRQFNQCLNLQAVGVTRDGGFAQYVAVPESAIFPIGDLSFAAAALVEPLACVVWGLKQVQLQAGDRVLILGAGPMGLLMMQTLRHAGATTAVVVDTSPSRLKLASQLGATAAIDPSQLGELGALAPYGFDLVADATGNAAAMEAGFQQLAPGGKLWIFGVAPAEVLARFTPYQIFRKDLQIIGSFALNKTFHEAIALMHSGAIHTELLISHNLPLIQFREALRVAECDPARMKVQLNLEEA
jgi:2-desacetyl-2-hydroxyethyl bacteriochlorophyllide A dehydrogenase